MGFWGGCKLMHIRVLLGEAAKGDVYFMCIPQCTYLDFIGVSLVEMWWRQRRDMIWLSYQHIQSERTYERKLTMYWSSEGALSQDIKLFIAPLKYISHELSVLNSQHLSTPHWAFWPSNESRHSHCNNYRIEARISKSDVAEGRPLWSLQTAS